MKYFEVILELSLLISKSFDSSFNLLSGVDTSALLVKGSRKVAKRKKTKWQSEIRENGKMELN